MPCYQSTNFPPGFSTTGRTGYRTEADCNQACKEGACCEGTVCTVKPQCQCQGDDKKFQGIGTVCAADTCQFCTVSGSPKTGSGVGECYCYCTANGGIVPRFVNVTFSYRLETGSPGCDLSQTQTFTLTRTPQSIYQDSPNSFGGRTCYVYFFANGDFEFTVEAAFKRMTSSGLEEAVNARFKVYGPPCPPLGLPQYDWMSGYEFYAPFLTVGSGLGTGICFSRLAGSTSTGGTGNIGNPRFNFILTINGFQ